MYFCTDKLLAWYDGNPDDNIYFLEVGIQLTENSRKFLESLSVRYDLKMSGTGDIREDYHENEVVWLNKSGNAGKGYDFVIRENGEDSSYYEVKSKTDEAPHLFSISGTQWGWAKKLHNSKRGGMYTILLISNVGKKEPKIREITDPVALWNAGKLYADPVNIEL